MKKSLITLILPLLLSSCDSIGFGKTKNVVELTQKLKIEKIAQSKLSNSHQGIVFHSSNEATSLNISNNVIAIPAIAKSKVFVLDQKGSVIAYSLKDKAQIWSSPIDATSRENYNIGNVLFSSDKLYITNGTRDLTIMSAEKGEIILSKTFPDIIQTKPVMVDDKIVVVQTISNQLIAFNTETAEIVWAIEGDLGVVTSRSHFSPILANGNIITSFNSGEVVSVNAKSGELKWAHSLIEQVNNFDLSGSLTPSVINAKPVVQSDYIYLASSNAKLMKIRISNGDIVWQKNIEDIQSMSLSNDRLIITTNGRQIAMLTTNNGTIVWAADLLDSKSAKRNTYPAIFQAPFVVTDINNHQSINVIASNGELYRFMIDENGNFKTEAEIISIAKNVTNYWISCCDNKLYLFNNKTVSF